MILVVSRDWCGFSLSQDFCDAYGLGYARYAAKNIKRDDPRLVKWVRDHADNCGRCGDLACVEIPDNCTDYEITDCDDKELITYVVDGKIYHA